MILSTQVKQLQDKLNLPQDNYQETWAMLQKMKPEVIGHDATANQKNFMRRFFKINRSGESRFVNTLTVIPAIHCHPRHSLSSPRRRGSIIHLRIHSMMQYGEVLFVKSNGRVMPMNGSPPARG